MENLCIRAHAVYPNNKKSKTIHSQHSSPEFIHWCEWLLRVSSMHFTCWISA